MIATLRAFLAMALIGSSAVAEEPRYIADAQYVRLLAVDSIELSTQLWLAIRASVEPKKIQDLSPPAIGFEWSDGATACRIRAIPTIGIDAYNHASVGYYLEVRAQAVAKTVPKLCAEPIQKLNEWYFSKVLGLASVDRGGRETYVREFRAVDSDPEVKWHAVRGKELMRAENVINDIVGGKASP